MGMLITTSTDEFDTDGTRAWIYSPSTTDGEAQGLAYSTSGMRVMNLLETLGLDTNVDFSMGLDYPLTAVEAALETAIDATDPMDDDYTYGLLMKAKTVITNGKMLGATFFSVA